MEHAESFVRRFARERPVPEPVHHRDRYQPPVSFGAPRVAALVFAGDRNGEAVARVVASAAGDRAVDADHVAMDVEQRTTRIARVDRRVCLDVIRDGVRVRAVGIEQLGRLAAFGAHDAGGHGEIELKRIADCQHPLPDARRGIVTQVERGKVVARVDLDHGDVGRRIATHHLGAEAPLVEQRDVHAVGISHDVVVGEDVSVVRDDEARPARLLRDVIRHVVWSVELPEEILEARRKLAAAADPGGRPRSGEAPDVDRDHGGTRVVGNGLER